MEQVTSMGKLASTRHCGWRRRIQSRRHNGLKRIKGKVGILNQVEGIWARGIHMGAKGKLKEHSQTSEKNEKILRQKSLDATKGL
jgi:hypothetical protein